MTKTAAPKRHADHITETTQVTDRITRTYSAKLKEHAVWIDGEIVATAHAINVFWSVVIGDPDGDARARKMGGIAQTEAQAITVLENAARKLATVA